MSLAKYNSPPPNTPEITPLVKLADVTQRNDARLEELLEEYLRNREKELDKIEEPGVD